MGETNRRFNLQPSATGAGNPASSEFGMIGAIETNLFGAWAQLACLPQVDYRNEADAIRFISGIPFPLCNSVMRADLAPVGIDGKIEEILLPFRERKLPMFWWIGPATKPADLGSRLEKHGLQYLDETVGMAVDLSGFPVDAEKEMPVRIREVAGEDSLQDWLAVFRTVFEVPEFVVEFFAAAMRNLWFGPDLPYRHFIGLAGGMPAAVSSVFFDAEAAGVYNVATLAEFRSRGIGTAMSRAAMNEARIKGCRWSVLHATPMGIPVYRKLGYRECCRLRIYSNINDSQR